MAKFTRPEINAVGNRLRAYLPYPYTPDIVHVFRTIHEYRLAHVTPLRAARSELSRAARRIAPSSIAPGRLKRLSSIRTKLRRTPLHLYDIQDIAGCRAIVPSMADLRALIKAYEDGVSQFELVRHWPYIDQPKPSGYRCHHMVLNAPGADANVVNRHRVEIQLRTELQHAWATTVEAVGLVRDEDLKAGIGDTRWLRLLTLMASVIALEEDCPPVPGTPHDHASLVSELADLESELGAVATLDSYKRAIRHIEEYASRSVQSFVVEYDNATRTVRVRSNDRFRITAEQSFQSEIGGENSQAVIIELDRVSDLRAAYPNYFLDVTLFAERLSMAVRQRSIHGPTSFGVAGKAKSGAERKWGNLDWLKDFYGAERR